MAYEEYHYGAGANAGRYGSAPGNTAYGAQGRDMHGNAAYGNTAYGGQQTADTYAEPIEYPGDGADNGYDARGNVNYRKACSEIIMKEQIFADALAFCREQGGASIRAVAQKFRIGFFQAARLIDVMEHCGFITCTVNESANGFNAGSNNGAANNNKYH